MMLHNPPTCRPGAHRSISRAWIKATDLVPDDYLGPVLTLCQERRGVQKDLTYAGTAR